MELEWKVWKQWMSQGYLMELFLVSWVEGNLDFLVAAWGCIPRFHIFSYFETVMQLILLQ